MPPPRKAPALPFHEDADLTKLSSGGGGVSAKDVRARIQGPATLATTLNIPSPGGNAARGLTPFAMPDGTKTEVPLAKIRPYDRNPRRAFNAAFEEIKASLAATGPGSLDLWVTQRPGDDFYMPYRGGNTRLAAIMSLAQEGDPRWGRLVVTHKRWVSEADTLAQHLIENNNRADMTFWDKACAYMVDMRGEIELELNTSELSLRRLEEEFAKRGVAVKKSHLSLYQFAIQQLSTVGPYLSATQLIQLQPAINQQARLCSKFDVGNAAFQEILDSVCAALLVDMEANESITEEGRLLASDVMAALDVAVSARLGATTEELRCWIDTLNRFPDSSRDELRNHPGLPEQTTPERAKAGKSPSERAGNQQIPPPGQVEGGQAPSPVNNTSPLDSVVALAEAACVQDCLRVMNGLPAGYYMETPASAIDVGIECEDSSHRVVAWQLLAILSGQWSEAVARQLPQDSFWRRMRLSEGGLDPDALSLYVQDHMLVDVGSQAIDDAKDIGWGVLVNLGWVVKLLRDPACGAALVSLIQHHQVSA